MTEAPAPSAPTDGARLSRRGVERLDLLLLTIEALDLNGGEAMVWTSQQMGLQAQFPNRVELWKRRCHNPCLLYTSPSPRDLSTSRMPSSA